LGGGKRLGPVIRQTRRSSHENLKGNENKPPNHRNPMTEDPGNLKAQRPKHTLARTIGVLIVMSTGYGVFKLIGIDTKNFWPFMVLVVGGSFIGNILGVFLAQKFASK
jgi:hypothetical protein